MKREVCFYVLGISFLLISLWSLIGCMDQSIFPGNIGQDSFEINRYLTEGEALVWNTVELARKSAVIAVGHVMNIMVKKGPYKNAGETIYTDVEIAVSECLAGEAPSTIYVRTQGGQIGDIGLWVSHEPRFSLGEEVVLFLAHNIDSPGYYRVCGGFRGKLTVIDGLVAELRIPLTAFLTSVQKALAGEDIGPEPHFIPLSTRDIPFKSTERIEPLASYSYWEMRWPEEAPRPVFWILARSTDWISPIEKAAKTWSSVGGCRLKFIYGGTTNRVAGVRDGYNVVEAYFNFGPTDWLAGTYVWYAVSGGGYYADVLECDIEINLYYRWAIGSFLDAYDVQNVVTHEFGHWFVLGDLYRPHESEQTMYGFASPGETKKRSLASGDKRGAADIY